MTTVSTARVSPPTAWSVEDRAASGKAARRRLPLDALAECPGDPLDAVAVLRAQDADRVPELVPVRYGRMLASPFAFYRGSAAVMAADLGGRPSSGLVTQLCGDAHLSNFGVFATPERRLIFDVNDFDETLPGPFEWDVKRLAASVALAGRDNGHRRRDRRRCLVTVLGVYRAAMRDFARQANLDVWYASLDLQRALTDLGARAGAKQRRRFADQLERARSRDSASAARKITVVVDGQRRFASSPPLLVPVHELFPDAEADELQEALGRVLGTYRASLYDDRRRLLDQFRLVDVARKVVGVGSVGSRAWVLLLTGRDDDDLLLLQAKEAGASVLEPYCPPSAYPSPGERVVAGQRLMQASSDIFLGWDRTGERDGHRQYYLRQLRDGKVSAEVGEMSPRRLAVYAGLCAWTLARAHARAGDRVAIAAYLGRKDAFEQALAEYAETYADRVEGQFHRLQEAAASGAVPVERGV